MRLLTLPGCLFYCYKYVIKPQPGPRKKGICPVNTVGFHFQNSRWDHYTFMTPSLSADVKLSQFISHLTEDGSHIKLRRVGLGAVWGRGNIYRSGSNWVLHPGKQYCHEWFRAAESAKLLFGSPAGAILHFTHSKNKTLRLTDCKREGKKRVWLTKDASAHSVSLLLWNRHTSRQCSEKPKVHKTRRPRGD